MIDREPYFFPEMFSGNWQKFKEAFSNPNSFIFYDMDGVLADTPKTVLGKFQKRTGIITDPAKIDCWDYLTRLAVGAKLSDYRIKHAEDDWYKAKTLSRAPRYLYMRPVVRKTVNLFGSENNFVLTSREPYLDRTTYRWIEEQYSEIPQKNVLIRKTDKVKPTIFKTDRLQEAAQKAPWVILVEDALKNVKAVLDTNIRNLVVVNIPLGLTKPDFEDDRLVVIKRYPDRLQAMFPLMDAIDRATR